MESTINEWGYFALFFYSFGGGMLGLAVAGVFSFSGDLNIYYVIITAFIANFVGDQVLFTIARNNKDYAKEMMQKHKRKIALSILMMRKYGSLVIFVQKYLYGIKTLIPLAMGISKYNSKKFMFLNILSSIIWSVVVGTTAYMMGEIVLNALEEYKIYGIIFIITVVSLIIYFVRKY